MKRLVAVTAVGAMLVAGTALPSAQADTPPLGTSYSAAAKVTPGAGLAPTISTGGAIGGLLDFLSPVLNQVVTPLASGLTSLPSTLVSSLVSGLLGAGYVANSPSSAQPPPSSGYPDCGSNGWNSSDCYGPLVPSISVPPLLTLGTGTLQGYAAADSTGSYAAAGTADPALSLLGVSVGDLGVSSSTSQCLSPSRVCSSSSALTSVSLLGNTVAVKSTSSGLQVSLGGGSFVALSALTATTVTGAGVTAHLQAQGAALRIGIDLSLGQLLSALGIANTLDSLGATDNGSTISLNLVIGNGSTSTTDVTKAWGLELSAGLAVNVALSVLGLVSVNLSAPDSSTGNLFDIQFAYSAAANADNSNVSGAPPDLT
jgi:hypothetical protein